MNNVKTSEYVPVHPIACDYMGSPTEMDIKLPSSGVMAGQARRTGITEPGFHQRAVYALFVGRKGGEQVRLPGLWVYDEGRLIESRNWHGLA